MKIGIDCRLWRETGVGRYTRNLVKYLQLLDKTNNYVLFVNSEDFENLKSEISNLKWNIVKTDIKWHTIREQLKFPSILNKENLDIVHFPYFSIPIFYNKPFIVTVHDLIIDHFSTGKASSHPIPLYLLKKTGYKFVLSHAIKKAEKLIVPSEATKHEIIDHFKIGDNKISVIHEGVDDNLSSKLKNQNSKVQVKSQKYFLYVGNAYPHKNLDRLIEAFIKLKSEFDQAQDVDLILVGKDDVFYKRLEEKVNSQKIDSIKFLHNINDSELAYLYKNAIVLVIPSFMEGFGLPVLEAMASSCINIVSNIPPFKEICKDTAFYFNPENTNDLKEKMKIVLALNEKEKIKYKKLGLVRSKMFSWDKMANETLKIYESCLKNKLIEISGK